MTLQSPFLIKNSLVLENLHSAFIVSRSQSQTVEASSGTERFGLGFSPGSTIICPLNNQFVLCLSDPCVKTRTIQSYFIDIIG